jgi:hydroxyethylthiazole kinase-like sugar kinase family protein
VSDRVGGYLGAALGAVVGALLETGSTEADIAEMITMAIRGRQKAMESHPELENFLREFIDEVQR